MAKDKTTPTPDTDATDPVEDVDPPNAEADEDETEEQIRERLNKATVSITFKGETFTIPKRKGRWRMGVHRDLGNNNLDEALIKLIGEDRYARLDAAGWAWDDFDELATQLQVLITAECVP